MATCEELRAQLRTAEEIYADQNRDARRSSNPSARQAAARAAYEVAQTIQSIRSKMEAQGCK